MYCNNCGDDIEPNQKFCEKCGSPVPSGTQRSQEVSSTPTTPTQTIESRMEPYNRPGGLFDINRNYYILKEKY